MREVLQIVKEKPATYQKKINEMFPTLGETPSPTKEQVKQSIAVVDKKPEPQKTEKAWWQKINDSKEIKFD